MSHAPLDISCSSAVCGCSWQQFGSNTLTAAPAALRTPARRQTPSGGARKVYSPQCGSYGPTSKILGEASAFTLIDFPNVIFAARSRMRLHVHKALICQTARLRGWTSRSYRSPYPAVERFEAQLSAE